MPTRYKIQPAPSEGKFANGDKTKLDGIEALADVTDATNVAAAGALMDSELTDITFIKALSDADVAAVNTGTSTTGVVTPDALAGSNFGKVPFGAQVNGSVAGSTALVTGDNQAVIMIDDKLNGMNAIAVKASCTTVSSSGDVTINIRRSRRSSATARTIVDILSTPITINASEFESSDATAPVIDIANDDLATGDMLLIDIDAAGTGVLGLTVLITAQLP